MGISGTPCMTWDMLRQMAAQGHEISSHGWEHKKVQRLSPEQLRFEVQHNDSTIYRETGQFPRTYFFPGNSRDSATLAYCMHDRVACRTFQIALGARRDNSWLRQWLGQLLRKHEWGVTMTHGIAMGYDHFTDPQVLTTFLDDVASLRDSLWVATFHDVAAYVRERDDVRLSVTTTDDGGLCVSLATTLDARLFSHPLTLVVDGFAIRSARQGDRELTPYRHQGRTLLDVSPHGGPIIIN